MAEYIPTQTQHVESVGQHTQDVGSVGEEDDE